MTKAARRRAAGEPLAALIRTLLKPGDAKRAKGWLADLEMAAVEGKAAKALAPHLGDDATAGFLRAVMDDSPFLRGLILADPGRLARLLATAPDASHAAICDTAAASWTEGDEASVMTTLREARAEAALLIALADLGGAWDVDRVMAALTAFADAATGAAASFALRKEHDAGTIRLPHPHDPQRDSGWLVLAMGKWGAGELNYSSDIDAIVLFDPQAAMLPEDAEPGKIYVRLTRTFVRLLDERTPDGYVLRVDLRLRPDPGSTAIAMSTIAAVQYYESRGQNWERAALIKARAAAGDIAAGDAFLAELGPFIWRKYLDYAAIADIHSIKRQIHDFRGHATVAIAGHNLKLGRGGIREIEFFVQTQQLIAGGRNPALRGARTEDMLTALAAQGWIADTAATDLAAAYRMLRSIEHRLQMVADDQTHSLPEDADGLARIARLLGLKGARALETELRPILEGVQDHYARLFESAPTLSVGTGNLVFTGDEDDPETMATLAGLGYGDPSGVAATIRGWHYGRYPAMRSANARERLTELTPALLAALGKTDSPDAAFLAFDRFLGRMPTGLQLFALLGSNPGLLGLFAMMLGTAPRLAEILTRRPHVFDALLEPAFFGGLPKREALATHLEQTLSEARSYEDALDRARVFGQEQSFLIGVRVIAGAVSAKAAGIAYADLADVLVASVFDLTREAFEQNHGVLPAGAVAVVAMGKFGSREMTAGSDLDLILLYAHAASATSSDGPRPLMGSQYYTRLTQRLVAALSAPTAEGKLYEVDFRLRPSGNAGPIATSLDAFTAYQAKDAWTWEQMALTRARAVAGGPPLMKKAERAITKALRRKRDSAKLAADVVEMRGLIQEEKGGEGHWDIKQAPGGLIDIEFIAQTMQLRHAADHPEVLKVETEAALAAARACGALAIADAEILIPALRLYQAVNQVLRLCVEGVFKPKEASRGLLDLLARAGEQPDFAHLDALLRETQTKVRAMFERLIGRVPTGKGPRPH